MTTVSTCYCDLCGATIRKPEYRLKLYDTGNALDVTERDLCKACWAEVGLMFHAPAVTSRALDAIRDLYRDDKLPRNVDGYPVASVGAIREAVRGRTGPGITDGTIDDLLLWLEKKRVLVQYPEGWALTDRWGI